MNKLQRVNEYMNVSQDSLEKYGAYNGYANIDSELYINPKLLINCKIPELKNSYMKLTKRFEKIIDCLRNSQTTTKNDLMWNLALNLFCFPEPKGVALGTSELSMDGKGLNGKTAENALKRIKEMINNNIDDPQMFGILAVIQKNIGVDRISDMIANVIYDDLLSYSQKIFLELNISNLVEIKFNEKTYTVMLRENGKPLILIPKVILSNIPPFIDYYSIQRIIDENIEIKKQIYNMFYEANKTLKKKLVSQVTVKDLTKEQIYEVINKFKLYYEIFEINNNKIILPYDFSEDIEGIHKPIEKIKNMIVKREESIINNILNIRNTNFKGLIEGLINNYKFIIENKGLNQELYHKIPTKTGKFYYKPKHEGTSQRLFIATLDATKKIYQFDYTYEPKSSNGEVDFRFYRNDEVIVVEFKLSTNKLGYGYNNQLVEYIKREEAKVGFLVIIQVKEDNAIENFKRDTKITVDRPVVIIDGLLKSNPSKILNNINM